MLKTSRDRLALGFLLFSLSAFSAAGQHSPGPKDQITVLSRGSNQIPQGTLGVITYRLEKRKLEVGRVYGNEEPPLSYSFRLVIITRKDLFGGPFSIWINDRKYPASFAVAGEFSVDIHRRRLPHNATLGFSINRDDSELSKTILSETLDVPVEYRMTSDEIEALKPKVRLIRYTRNPGIVYLRIELPEGPGCSFGAYTYSIEIEGQVIMTLCDKSTFIGITSFKLLEKMSGSEITVKRGPLTDDRWSAGRVDINALEIMGR